MKMIAAADEEGGIGRNGDIPWNYPRDIQYVKFRTLHSDLVMGRKTFENSGQLPKRKMFILSKQKSGYLEGSDDLVRYVSLEELFTSGYESPRPLFNCGGGQIYHLLFEYVDTAFITRISGNYNCDTFLPNLSNRLVKASEFNLSEDLTVERWITKNKIVTHEKSHS